MPFEFMPSVTPTPPVPHERLRARYEEIRKLLAERLTDNHPKSPLVIAALAHEAAQIVGWAQNPGPGEALGGPYGGFDEASWIAASKFVAQLQGFVRARAEVLADLAGVPEVVGMARQYQVNGKLTQITQARVTYEEIVAIVRGPGAPGWQEKPLYTVTYKDGHFGAQGVLAPGGSVHVEPGMKFNAVVTGSA